jgi:hypothetical protein
MANSENTARMAFPQVKAVNRTFAWSAGWSRDGGIEPRTCSLRGRTHPAPC